MKKKVMLMLCTMGMAFALTACQGDSGTTDVVKSGNEEVDNIVQGGEVKEAQGRLCQAVL